MVSRTKVAVVVDSAASLPVEMISGRSTGLFIVPMQLNIGNNVYLDGLDLTPSEFYTMQRLGKEIAKTSAPTPESFLTAFEAAAKVADHVLCLTVSAKFSSSYFSASSVIEDVRSNFPHTKFALVDTGSAAGGEGLVVTEALRVSRIAKSWDQVLLSTNRVICRISLFAYLDTLKYVSMSGRVPKMLYITTSILNIKPVVEMAGGGIRTIDRVRGSTRATESLIESIRRKIGGFPLHISIMHADVGDEAEKICKKIRSEFDCVELYVSEFSPVMGAHTGPGLLALAYWEDYPDYGNQKW